MRRITIVVMDSAGIGALPDAAEYGDAGSNTLVNISKAYNGFSLPNLQKLGLGNIADIKGVTPAEKPRACFGMMAEMSPGKDTTTGHWEISGLQLKEPFPVFPEGFPEEVVAEFEKRTGIATLGNIAASGTEIIEKLGREHIQTGKLIIYTSADSVFQIAAHEDIIPVNQLFDICRIAREILTGPYAVGRVIARPFNGDPGNFKRTARRRDFSLDPTGTTVLDMLKERGYAVKAVGKIFNIFNGRGITHSVETHSNLEGMEATMKFLEQKFNGLIFTNLVDFDMLYGHRNNVRGYAEALMEFDSGLPGIISLMDEDDILMITADHGCDPTTKSTDHSREYVPLLVYRRCMKEGISLGTRKSFADIAATVAGYFGFGGEGGIAGDSFLDSAGSM